MFGDQVWLTVQFQFIPKALDGFEIRTLCRPVKFLYTKLGKQERDKQL